MSPPSINPVSPSNVSQNSNTEESTGTQLQQLRNVPLYFSPPGEANSPSNIDATRFFSLEQPTHHQRSSPASTPAFVYGHYPSSSALLQTVDDIPSFSIQYVVEQSYGDDAFYGGREGVALGNQLQNSGQNVNQDQESQHYSGAESSYSPNISLHVPMSQARDFSAARPVEKALPATRDAIPGAMPPPTYLPEKCEQKIQEILKQADTVVLQSRESEQDEKNRLWEEIYTIWKKNYSRKGILLQDMADLLEKKISAVKIAFKQAVDRQNITSTVPLEKLRIVREIMKKLPEEVKDEVEKIRQQKKMSTLNKTMEGSAGFLPLGATYLPLMTDPIDGTSSSMWTNNPMEYDCNVQAPSSQMPQGELSAARKLQNEKNITWGKICKKRYLKNISYDEIGRLLCTTRGTILNVFKRLAEEKDTKSLSH